MPRPLAHGSRGPRGQGVDGARTALAALLLVGTVAGTASCADPAVPATAQSPVRLASTVPVVGTWTLRDGDDAGSVVQIGDGLEVWLPCGLVDVTYLLAPDEVLVARPTSWSGSCDVPEAVGWVTEARALELTGDELRVLDADGRATARLTRGGSPDVPEDVDPSLAEDPVLDEPLRARLAPASVDLPDGLTAPAEGALAGRWLPAEPVGDPTASFLELRADRTWHASDGCNQTSSIWYTVDGALRTGAAAWTEMGCEGVPVPTTFVDAHALGTDADGRLVLLDEDLRELLVLVRAD